MGVQSCYAAFVKVVVEGDSECPENGSDADCYEGGADQSAREVVCVAEDCVEALQEAEDYNVFYYEPAAEEKDYWFPGEHV